MSMDEDTFRAPPLAVAGRSVTSRRRLVVDDICLELAREPVSARLLRRHARQAVEDLQHSISPEALPEMATRLTLVRITALPCAWAS